MQKRQQFWYLHLSKGAFQGSDMKALCHSQWQVGDKFWTECTFQASHPTSLSNNIRATGIKGLYVPKFHSLAPLEKYMCIFSEFGTQTEVPLNERRLP